MAALVAELHTRWQADSALRTDEFQPRPALKAELRLRRILVLTFRAFHGFPLRRPVKRDKVYQIKGGMGRTGAVRGSRRAGRGEAPPSKSRSAWPAPAPPARLFAENPRRIYYTQFRLQTQIPGAYWGRSPWHHLMPEREHRLCAGLTALMSGKAPKVRNEFPHRLHKRRNNENSDL